MKIIMGKLVGGRSISGTSSKTGKPYNITNIVISTAQKNCFEAMPEVVSIPQDRLTPANHQKLLSMPIGAEVCISVETQSRNDGPDQQVFLDWFSLPNAGAGAAR